MTINLDKLTQPALPRDTIESLRGKLALRIFDSYCESALRAEMIRQGVADLGLDVAKATIIIDMELDAMGCANESKLCEELDALLHRFTDKDKKLDPKERSDAIQLVCRPKPGTSKGLAFDVAERRVIEFCRANRVKVKVGILRWDTP